MRDLLCVDFESSRARRETEVCVLVPVPVPVMCYGRWYKAEFVFACTISADASNRNVIPNDVHRIMKNKLVAANRTVGRLDLPQLEALGGGTKILSNSGRGLNPEQIYINITNANNSAGTFFRESIVYINEKKEPRLSGLRKCNSFLKYNIKYI